MKNYLFILPVIPHYRFKFFKRVTEKIPNIEIMAGEHQCIGPSSSKESKNIASLDHNVICLLSHKVMWQKNISISHKYKTGDVVLISGNPRILSNYLIIIKAKIRGLKLVWFGQGWTAGSNRIRNFIKRLVMSFCDSVILYTQEEAENTKLFMSRSKKIFYINNTVDTENIFSIKNKISIEMLKDFKKNMSINDSRVLLFVGRLEGKEKLNILLDSLVDVCSKDEKVLLIVIGNGSFLPKYREYSVKKGIAGHIRWLGAIYKEEELAYWFLSADCFVYPGAIGLSLLHAFSYGLPVITHNNFKNQMPEIVALNDRYNGLLYLENNYKHLSKMIINMISDDNIRAKYSLNALKVVEDRFTFDQMVDRFAIALKSN
jgi:glycosyltransferase involved in cell wall biosynthesis